MIYFGFIMSFCMTSFRSYAAYKEAMKAHINFFKYFFGIFFRTSNNTRASNWTIIAIFQTRSLCF